MLVDFLFTTTWRPAAATPHRFFFSDWTHHFICIRFMILFPPYLRRFFFKIIIIFAFASDLKSGAYRFFLSFFLSFFALLSFLFQGNVVVSMFAEFLVIILNKASSIVLLRIEFFFHSILPTGQRWL